VLRRKARRIVISTNGYYTERIVRLAKEYPFLGIRVSLEGLPAANDKLRGIPDGFDHGLRTILQLHRMGIKDIGFGITVSDANIMDMVELYELAKAMKLEFATACVHNSYYFHKWDHRIGETEKFRKEFNKLIGLLLKGGRVKDWYRAYFNCGLLNYALGNKRLLPCRAGMDVFFVDPFGDVMACNGMDKKLSMGNLKEKSFTDIWNSEKAKELRVGVKDCPKNCWMIGTASPAMKRNILKPTLWIIKHKFLGASL